MLIVTGSADVKQRVLGTSKLKKSLRLKVSGCLHSRVRIRPVNRFASWVRIFCSGILISTEICECLICLPLNKKEMLIRCLDYCRSVGGKSWFIANGPQEDLTFIVWENEGQSTSCCRISGDCKKNPRNM